MFMEPTTVANRQPQNANHMIRYDRTQRISVHNRARVCNVNCTSRELLLFPCRTNYRGTAGTAKTQFTQFPPAPVAG